MHGLYAFVIYGSAVLGAVLVALSLYVLATRWLSDRPQARTARLQSRMLEAVEACLGGRLPVDQALRELEHSRTIALGVLLDLASTCSPGHRPRLKELAQRLDFEADAIRALSHRNPAIRARAATRLGYLGGRAAAPALLEALYHEQLDVRLCVAEALVQLHHTPAILPILDALCMPGRWPVRRATELLLGFDQDAVAPLRRFLATGDTAPEPQEVVVALNVLGMLAAREALPEVMHWSEHEQVEIRAAAARAMGRMVDPIAVPVLARLLVDEHWEVRSMAAKALGQLCEPSTIPILEPALADPAWWVRFNAGQALAELGTEGIEALHRAMTTQQDGFARDISRQLLEEHKLHQRAVTS